MICPSCGTWNREEARFCKQCGARVREGRAPSAPPSIPPPSPLPPPAISPRPARPRTWWHGLGVFAIVAAFLLSMDLAATGHVTWSLVVVLSAAFLVGAAMMLGVLSAPARPDRKPLWAGAALLVAAVVLLPVAIALQSAPTILETYVVPTRPGVTALDLRVTDDAGRVTVRFAADVPYLARAEVTHIGGLFSSHYEGDLTLANATSGGTTTLTIATQVTATPFFLAGHDIAVTINASAAASMSLTSATGTLDVRVPAGVELVGAGIAAKVTTGSVSVATEDVSWAGGAGIAASSTTGAVALSIVQTSGTGGTVGVSGTSTTGSVTFDFTGGVGIAAKVASTVTTGSVRYDATKYSGASSAELYAPDETTFASSPMQFLVSLASTTGGIALG